jgi:hypothetical protein
MKRKKKMYELIRKHHCVTVRNMAAEIGTGHCGPRRWCKVRHPKIFVPTGFLNC